MDNGMVERKGLNDALQVHESFHFLKALQLPGGTHSICSNTTAAPASSMCHALGSMVCYAKVEVPFSISQSPFRNVVHVVARPCQTVLRQSKGRGRTGQAQCLAHNGAWWRQGGVWTYYQVPQVTMSMENLDSDEDFVQQKQCQDISAVPLSCSSVEICNNKIYKHTISHDSGVLIHRIKGQYTWYFWRRVHPEAELSPADRLRKDLSGQCDFPDQGSCLCVRCNSWGRAQRQREITQFWLWDPR